EVGFRCQDVGIVVIAVWERVLGNRRLPGATPVGLLATRVRLRSAFDGQMHVPSRSAATHDPASGRSDPVNSSAKHHPVTGRPHSLLLAVPQEANLANRWRCGAPLRPSPFQQDRHRYSLRAFSQTPKTWRSEGPRSSRVEARSFV